MGAAESARPGRKGRRRLFFALLLAFIWCALELLGFAAWSVANGRLFSWGRANGLRAAAIAESGGVAEADGDLLVRGAVRHGSMLHPYLGFVHAPPKQENPSLPVSSFGFHGEQSPVQQRRADRYIVGVTGGSVALHFTLYGREAFERALRRSPKLRGREIEIIALALGGYKQPQQLLAVQLISALGGEFDCIVNLDGFNEVALVNENVPIGVPGWYPRSWSNLASSVPDPDQLRRIGEVSVLTEQRRTAAESAGFWWWSPLLQFAWSWRDLRLKNRIDALRIAAEHAARRLPPAAIGPGTSGKTLAEARREMVDVWRRCSEQLAEHCRANGIDYFHFLQPNQYVPGSKPIGPAEAKVAIDPEHPWREGVLDGYPLLQAAGVRLKQSGVDFTDLTLVFAGVEEPLYFDTCCHFGRRGHAILAEHIAAAIRRRIDVGDAAIERLRVEPAELQIESPLASVQVRVFGVTAAGDACDLSGVGFGVRMHSEPAGLLHISPDGRVRARLPGDGELVVQREGVQVRVPVHAAWPAVVSGDDVRPAATGERPRLGADTKSSPGVIDVVCSDLPAAPFRFVAVSARPLPDARPEKEALDVQLWPVVGEGRAIRQQVPWPEGGAGLAFVRCYALDADASRVVAASNTVVLTRQ